MPTCSAIIRLYYRHFCGMSQNYLLPIYRLNCFGSHTDTALYQVAYSPSRHCRVKNNGKHLIIKIDSHILQ